MFSVFNKKDFENTFWFIAEKILVFATGVFIVPKIFSSLGSAGTGDLEYVKSVLGMLAPVIFLGLSEISIREIIYNPKKRSEVLATVFILQLISWMSVAAVIIIYLLLSGEDRLFALFLIILFSYLFRISAFYEYHLQAAKQVKTIFIVKIFSILLITSLQYLGVSAAYSLDYFAMLAVMEFIFQGIIYSLLIVKNNREILSGFRFSLSLSKKLLRSSAPLILTNLLISVYITIDELVLKEFHFSEGVGLFASVQFLVIGLSWNIGYAIINALYPSIAESYTKGDKIQYLRKMYLLFKTVAILGLSIGLFFTFSADDILGNFFSDEYQVATSALRIFGWAPLVVFIGMVYEKHLLNINKLYKDVYRFTVGIGANVLLSLLLIPSWSVTGAAIAVLLSHIIVNILYIFIDKESRKHFAMAVAIRNSGKLKAS